MLDYSASLQRLRNGIRVSTKIEPTQNQRYPERMLRHPLIAVWLCLPLGCSESASNDSSASNETSGAGGESAASPGSGGDDDATAGDDTGEAVSYGDPGEGLVECAGESCDVNDGQVCCLWLEGDPPTRSSHACMESCEDVAASLGTQPTTVLCDGPEDCATGHCCGGACSMTQEPCAGTELCHVAADCAGECCELRNTWNQDIGLCRPSCG